MFQNHYGWIETCCKTVSLSQTRKVSKPLRLDWDVVVSLSVWTWNKFQNHYGWIETVVNRDIIRVNNSVSKPLRLDWDQNRRNSIRLKNAFQNHYGWIETRRTSYFEPQIYRFQNHYGWIETNQQANLPQNHSRFKTTTVGLRPTCCWWCSFFI